MTPEFLAEFDFFAGVPDSRLKALCDFLLDTYGLDPRHHVIAANEGNATALAAGYHLATRKTPVVYLQNSGLGNVLNPVASLLNDKVYGIPCLFIVGWRGEPGLHDEPQHVFQGQITLPLLKDLDLETYVIRKDTGEEELASFMARLPSVFASGRSAALVVCEGALSYKKKAKCENSYSIKREDAIRRIVAAAGEDCVVSTTGKASRELYEIREQDGGKHQNDFLTVGSMGHSSSIALGIALQRPERKVWCIDGDGAALMHMGALAVIGSIRPANLVHVVVNNAAHESVGGYPTVADQVDLTAIARACGYPQVCAVRSLQELDSALDHAKSGEGPFFIEIKCAQGSRADLGRPATTPQENKVAFMLGFK